MRSERQRCKRWCCHFQHVRDPGVRHLGRRQQLGFGRLAYRRGGKSARPVPAKAVAISTCMRGEGVGLSSEWGSEAEINESDVMKAFSSVLSKLIRSAYLRSISAGWTCVFVQVVYSSGEQGFQVLYRIRNGVIARTGRVGYPRSYRIFPVAFR